MAENGVTERKPSELGLARVVAVGAYLGISRSKVYALMDDGSLPYVKLGKSRRVPWEAVLRLVEANTISAED
jgi:excisionase family DNA binding protein